MLNKYTLLHENTIPTGDNNKSQQSTNYLSRFIFVCIKQVLKKNQKA